MTSSSKVMMPCPTPLPPRPLAAARIPRRCPTTVVRADANLPGACDGSLACSTCHVVLEQSQYDAMDPPDEEEEDMLDLAFGLTDTSRLGCQIKVDKSLAGMVATVPTGAFDLSPK